MKILKFIILINLLLIILQGVNYYSLKVSEKYETQLEGFVEMTPEILNDVQKKKLEIEREIKNIKHILIMLLVSLTCLFSIYYIKITIQ
jgi:hypothetical protein